MNNPAQMLVIGEFVLNTDSRKLFDRDNNEVALAPTLFTLLMYFVDNQNAVLSKEMIMANVWKGKIVGEANVNQNIKKLRDILGDSAMEPRYIETVIGEGFRFIGNSDDYKAAPSTPPIYSSKPILFLISSLILLALISIILLRQESTPDIIKQLKPLTTLKGWEHYPDVSQDGRFIVFSHKHRNSWDIYLKPIDQESYTPIVATEDNERFPVISSDQKKLIYFSKGNNSCGLYSRTIDLESASVEAPLLIKACEKGNERFRAEWINLDELYISINDDSNSPASIYHFEISTKTQTLVSKPDVKGFGDYVLKYSQFNNKLAYIRNIGWTSSEIWIFDNQSKQHKKILSIPLMLSGLDWSEDGWLYFQSDNKEISRIQADGKDQQVVARVSSNVHVPFVINHQTIGVVSGDFSVIDVDAYDIDKNQHQILINSSFNDYFASGGSDFIAFVSNRSGLPQIWLKESDGSSRQLTQFQQSFELNWLSVSETKDLVMFGKSGHINIFNRNGQVVFDSENYSNKIYKNPVFDIKNNRFIYATQFQKEWNIEVRDLDFPGETIRLFKGVTARPCINSDCILYIKDKDPLLYRYNTKENTSEALIKLEPLTKSDEWDLVDDQTLLYLEKREKLNRIVQVDLQNDSKTTILELKPKMFSFDKNRRTIYTNSVASGNIDLTYFSL